MDIGVFSNTPLNRIQFLGWNILLVILLIMGFAYLETNPGWGGFLVLMHLVGMAAVSARRLMDFGSSPLFAIFSIIPVISPFFVLILLVIPGKVKSNEG